MLNFRAQPESFESKVSPRSEASGVSGTKNERNERYLRVVDNELVYDLPLRDR